MNTGWSIQIYPSMVLSIVLWMGKFEWSNLYRKPNDTLVIIIYTSGQKGLHNALLWSKTTLITGGVCGRG